MSDALSAMRRSQLLGVAITRDPSAHTPHDTRRNRFPFRLHLGNKHAPTVPSTPVDEVPSSPSQSEDDPFVWDVPNPFAVEPLDPEIARVHDLVQADIARARRNESVGPLQDAYDGYDSDLDDEDDLDEDDEGYDSLEDDDSHGGDDADDEDSDDDAEDVDKPNVIALPQLLHTVPLCFVAPTHAPSPSPSPTSLFYPSSSDEDLDKEDTPWADLAQAYNDIAEAEERAARKAKRDAQRSRLKVLAILGPEASSAL